MDITQAAKLLETLGFLLGSIFGGILLDEAVGGKLAAWFRSLLITSADRVRIIAKKMWERIINPEELNSLILIVVIASVYVSSFILIIIGWTQHIPIVLWTGIGLYSVYALFVLGMPILFFVPGIQKITGFRLVAEREGRVISKKEFLPEFSIWMLVLLPGIIWIPLLAWLLICAFFKASESTMKTLSKPKVPKVSLTVLGYTMLLSGLIIDTIVSF
jgi:hypothetical protein